MDEPVRITDHGDGTLEVSLYGDIDFANSPSVREAIRAAVADATPPAIRVDLGAVTFLDSSGIAVLVIAHRLASSAGARFAVTNPSAAVYEHLRLTGLADLFGVERPAPADGQPQGADAGGTDRPAPPAAR
jgi:anti-sigma B factor antagonist